ncbi:hypothetical protein G9A89_009833 [Geosiphon pyriformis]|nr:hypothetical protein G9A89_009833 [Geosiphon pyriformis]
MASSKTDTPVNGASSGSKNSQAASYTVADLLEKISSFIESCDFELAYTFCVRALSMEPDNVKVLETAGAVELELEKFEEAREAISLNPTKGAAKYLYMGQLSESLDSVNYFQTGIDLMIAELENLVPASEEYQGLCRKISTALCSMTEIFLTDCCFEPDAESRCETYLSRAVAVDVTNPEVYQLLASVRLSQQRNEDAKLELERSINLWIHLEPGQASLPSYATRISLVKLLLELSEYNRALAVLEGLQKEDDEVIELWYLYGWCYYCMGEDAPTDEEHSANWEDARDCLKACEKLLNRFESDEGIREHVEELIQTIRKGLNISASESDNVERTGGDADECEDFSNDDNVAEEMEM